MLVLTNELQTLVRCWYFVKWYCNYYFQKWDATGDETEA